MIAPPPGTPDRARLGPVEPHDELVARAVADRARAARCRPARPRGCRAGAGSPSGRADALLDEVAEVDAAQPLDEVGEHPVRRRRVVLEARARLPLELPLREARAAARGVGAVESGHRRVREARGVQHHLLDGDRVLAVGRELGHVVGDRARHVEQAVADQQPHRRRDDRLRAREDAVPGVVASRRRTSRTRRARRRGRPRAGTTAASRSPRRRARCRAARGWCSRGETIRLRSASDRGGSR